MKEPSKPPEDEQVEKPNDGPLTDEEFDRFLEAIYEARGKKLPDYMRTRK